MSVKTIPPSGARSNPLHDYIAQNLSRDGKASRDIFRAALSALIIEQVSVGCFQDSSKNAWQEAS